MVTVPVPILRLMMWLLVPSLSTISPFTVIFWLLALIVCVALALQVPLILPCVVNEPPVVSVSAAACALPNVILFATAAVLIVGALVKVETPISTISFDEGIEPGTP